MNIDLADTKYQKPVSEKKISRDFGKTILIFFLLIILGWGGFLVYQKISLTKEQTSLKTSINTIATSVKTLTNSDNPAKKILVAKTLKKIKNKRILWSEVMAKIVKLENPGISFQDFTVTPEGEVSGTMSARSFNAIQQFIAKLNKKEDIQQIVIRSISLDKETSGLKVELNFNLKI